MRANNALGIDDELRGLEDQTRGMKPKMGRLTSTNGPGSDPSSQPTTSGHDLPVLPGQSPRPGGPSTASIVEAKPPAPPRPVTTVAKPPAPAPPPARRKPTAKPPSRGGRRT